MNYSTVKFKVTILLNTIMHDCTQLYHTAWQYCHYSMVVIPQNRRAPLALKTIIATKSIFVEEYVCLQK